MGRDRKNARAYLNTCDRERMCCLFCCACLQTPSLPCCDSLLQLDTRQGFCVIRSLFTIFLGHEGSQNGTAFFTMLIFEDVQPVDYEEFEFGSVVLLQPCPLSQC